MASNKINTKVARDKLLSFFSEEHQAQIAPIVDTLIAKAHADGIVRGRAEAATMIEVLVLGDGDYTDEELRSVMHSLRQDS